MRKNDQTNKNETVFEVQQNQNLPMIQVRNLRKEYPIDKSAVVALENINLDIPRGQVLCIFGTSGSGKSTLLNQLAGLERPTKGAVRIAGEVISQMDDTKLARFRQEHLGFVFQAYNLLPTMTAVENVALPLMLRGIPKKQREARALQMLELVGLKERAEHFPRQMSGGQQQRVGIARAFVTCPHVVFADEPTGNLDSKTTSQIMSMICAFAKKMNQTIVLVTHDPSMAAYADRIVTLVDGRIISDVSNTATALAQSNSVTSLAQGDTAAHSNSKPVPFVASPAKSNVSSSVVSYSKERLYA